MGTGVQREGGIERGLSARDDDIRRHSWNEIDRLKVIETRLSNRKGLPLRGTNLRLFEFPWRAVDEGAEGSNRKACHCSVGST